MKEFEKGDLVIRTGGNFEEVIEGKIYEVTSLSSNMGVFLKGCNLPYFKGYFKKVDFKYIIRKYLEENDV